MKSTKNTINTYAFPVDAIANIWTWLAQQTMPKNNACSTVQIIVPTSAHISLYYKAYHQLLQGIYKITQPPATYTLEHALAQQSAALKIMQRQQLWCIYQYLQENSNYFFEVDTQEAQNKQGKQNRQAIWQQSLQLQKIIIDLHESILKQTFVNTNKNDENHSPNFLLNADLFKEQLFNKAKQYYQTLSWGLMDEEIKQIWQLYQHCLEKIPQMLSIYQQIMLKASQTYTHLWLVMPEDSLPHQLYLSNYAGNVEVIYIHWAGHQHLKTFPESLAEFAQANIEFTHKVDKAIANNFNSMVNIYEASHLEVAALQCTELILQAIEAKQLNIGIVSQDRALTRRVKQLLTALNLPIKDETGWKLSTHSLGTALHAYSQLLYVEFKQNQLFLNHLFKVLQYKQFNFFIEEPNILINVWQTLPSFLQNLTINQQIDYLIETFNALAIKHIELKEAKEAKEVNSITIETSCKNVVNLLNYLQQRLLKTNQILPKFEQSQALNYYLRDLKNALNFIAINMHSMYQNSREFLAYRQQIILALRKNQLKSIKLTQQDWLTYLNWCLEQTNIADLYPNSNLTICIHALNGSRMRSFDRLIILGVDDDKLPSSTKYNAWLHQDLQKYFKLPNKSQLFSMQARDFNLLLKQNSLVDTIYYHQEDTKVLLSRWLQKYVLDKALNIQTINHNHLSKRVQYLMIAKDSINLSDSKNDPTSKILTINLPENLQNNHFNKAISISHLSSLPVCEYQFYLKHQGIEYVQMNGIEQANLLLGQVTHACLHALHSLTLLDLKAINFVKWIEDFLQNYPKNHKQKNQTNAFNFSDYQTQYLKHALQKTLIHYQAWRDELALNNWKIVASELNCNTDCIIDDMYLDKNYLDDPFNNVHQDNTINQASLSIKGRLDCVIYHEQSNTLCIIDFKCKDSVFDKTKLIQQNLQLQAYQKALTHTNFYQSIEHAFAVTIETCFIYTLKPDWFNHIHDQHKILKSADNLLNLNQQLNQAFQILESKTYQKTKKTQDCTYCNYQSFCLKD